MGKLSSNNSGIDESAIDEAIKILDLTKWKAATIGDSEPSVTLAKVNEAIEAWDKTTESDLLEQIKLLSAIYSATGKWITSGDAEPYRKAVGEKLERRVGKAATIRKNMIKALEEIDEMLTDDPMPTSTEERNRYNSQITVVRTLTGFGDSLLSNGDKVLKAVINNIQQLTTIDQRVQALQLAETQEQDRKKVAKYIPKGGDTETLFSTHGKDDVRQEIINSIFDDFMNYGQGRFTYSTSVSKQESLQGGGTTGACASFAGEFRSLVNAAYGKKILKVEMIAAKNFYTIPISQMNFIDTKCPGNLIDLTCSEKESLDSYVASDAKRYFFSEHWVAKYNNYTYDPTTGLHGSAADNTVAESGFVGTPDTYYKKGNEYIKYVSQSNGYGGGTLAKILTETEVSRVTG